VVQDSDIVSHNGQLIENVMLRTAE